MQYVQVFNLYDPAVLGITSFKPGEMYAADLLPIEVEVENWGNTEVDFDLRATVYSAIPNDVFAAHPVTFATNHLRVVQTLHSGLQMITIRKDKFMTNLFV